MTDEQYKLMTDDEKRTWLAAEIKKNELREQWLKKESRKLSTPDKWK